MGWNGSFIYTYIDVREHANPNTVIMVIGNKSDLESKRQVSREEGEQFAKENDLFFLEASAKSADNVEEAFARTAQTIQQKISSGAYDLSSESNGIKLAPSQGNSSLPSGTASSGGSGCC